MSLYYLFLVAAIQGLTEFLPVSSSGHLILLPGLTGYRDQGQFIDVAVHVGTLAAVVLYFRADVRAALAGIGDLMSNRRESSRAQLARNLIVGTVPIVIFGALLHFTGLDNMLRSVKTIAWTMLIFGLVLYWADRTGASTRQTEDWRLRDAVFMGLWQALALFPGTSRSGITISAARRLGYERSSAARLSMLLSIPAIIASGTLLGLEVVAQGGASALLREAAIAAVFAFLAALLALTLMMRLLRSVNFTPYVIYRVILGVILLVYAYG